MGFVDGLSWLCLYLVDLDLKGRCSGRLIFKSKKRGENGIRGWRLEG